MSKSEEFYALLFEVSNEDRDMILSILSKEKKRVSDLSRELNLTYPEIRRHISRLLNIGLILRDIEGFYHLTPYGETCITLFDEFDFISKQREYFKSHTPTNIPPVFLKRLSELSRHHFVDNFMEFLTFIGEKINEANEFVWLCIDQYPLMAIDSLLNSVERGVKVRIIEPNRLSGPNVTFEDKHILTLGSKVSDVMVKVHDRKDVYLFISDVGSAVSFPSGDSFDYAGFTVTEREFGVWGEDIFNHYWKNAELKVPVLSEQFTQESKKKGKTITITAHNDPVINSNAIQNAVDNYDEVILRGKFRLAETGIHNIELGPGRTVIKIRKSVVIRGEGRTDNTPDTKIEKISWKFPFSEFDEIFEVDNNDIDVTIENIHFQDFNGTCIAGSNGNSIKIRNNQITINHGLGRGCTVPNMGDHIIGISVWAPSQDTSGFPGGVLIEGNYLDFSYGRLEIIGGYIPHRKEMDPEYRPNHEKHENYLGHGIMVMNCVGNIVIRDNIVRNMNTKSIVVQDNPESSSIEITRNKVFSDIYGSFGYSHHYAGIGIQAVSAWYGPDSGSSVYISDNDVHFTKLNYCGIGVFGPSTLGVRTGASKLGECVVENNRIILEDGFTGVIIRKNDDTQVSGKAYYGFHLSGSRNRMGSDLGSNSNLVKNNDLSELEIKPSDDYSDSHVDGRMFTGSEGKSFTGHVWLNEFTTKNEIILEKGGTVIDEGTDNHILYQS
jgi:predicted transcriptional regulator